jgi:hypothetical protein
MDPVLNPYSPGAGNTPRSLVGRDADLQAFEIAVRRIALGRHDRSVIVTGLRGVGKTVLLREYGRIAQGEGWLHEHVEARDGTDFVRVAAEMVRRAVLRLSMTKRLAAQAGRVAGVLKAFQVRWNLPDGGDLTVGVDPLLGTADSGLLDRDLASLFNETGQFAHNHGCGVLLTVDEMQFLPKDHFTALIMGLHEVSQLNLPIVVAGAGLPSLLTLAGDARSYAERLFDFRTVGRLSPEGSAAALVGPADAEGVQWTVEALDRIVELTDGYPYFLQEFGKQAWTVAEGPDVITEDNVDVAVPLATEELDRGFFRVRFDRTTDTERAYLEAMARAGGSECASGAVARALGKTTTGVAQTRDALIRRGLCFSPRHGVIAFTVPMFDQYLRRRSELRRG